MTQRLPHPLFGGIWIAWTLGTIPVLVLTALPGGRWYGLFEWAIWLGTFLLAESVLTRILNTPLRDTLSEVVTWAHRQMAVKGEIAWDRGWTAAFTSIVLLISVTGAMPWFVIGQEAGFTVGIVLTVLGVLQAVLHARWLYDHFIHTETFG